MLLKRYASTRDFMVVVLNGESPSFLRHLHKTESASTDIPANLEIGKPNLQHYISRDLFKHILGVCLGLLSEMLAVLSTHMHSQMAPLDNCSENVLQKI